VFGKDEPDRDGANAVKRGNAPRPSAIPARGDTDLAHWRKSRGARAPNPEGALGLMSPGRAAPVCLLRQRDVFRVEVLLDALRPALAAETDSARITRHQMYPQVTVLAAIQSRLRQEGASMQQRPTIASASLAKNGAADLLRAIRGGEKPTDSAGRRPALRLISSILRAGTRMRLCDADADGAVAVLRHKRGKTRLPVTHGAVALPAELPHGRAELWLVRDDHVSGPVNVRIAGPERARV
jgi:hypothetical protein